MNNKEKKSTPNSNPLIKISGLWKNNTKTGEGYLSGKTSHNGKWMVMKNKFKKNDYEPDYILYNTDIQESSPKPAEHADAPDTPQIDRINFDDMVIDPDDIRL